MPSQWTHSDLLSEFEKKLPTLDAENRATERYGAPRLSVFSLLWPDERRITWLLADLLDPSGSHGQGTLFLNLVLRAANLPELADGHSRVSISVDAFTDRGRMIDILIDMPNALLGIEVKIYASQSKDQLKDYSAYIDALSQMRTHLHRAEDFPWKLIFLAQQEPETAKDTVIRMPWVSGESEGKDGIWAQPLRDLLEQALPQIRARKTRELLDEFLSWIDKKFWNNAMNDDQFEEYGREISLDFEHPERRRALGMFMLESARNQVHHKVIDAIGHVILDKLLERWPDLQFEHGAVSLYDKLHEQHDEWALRRPVWPNGAALALQNNDKVPFRHVFFGLRALDPKSEDAKSYVDHVCNSRDDIDRVVVKKLPKGQNYPWWSWCVDIKNSSWDSQFAAQLMIEAPEGDIVRHPDIEFIVNHLSNICEKMNLLEQEGSEALG